MRPNITLSTIGCLLAVACGTAPTVNSGIASLPNTGINTVSVAPAIGTMKVGDTVRFTAAVDAGSSGAAGVLWASSDPAKVGVDGDGLASALVVTVQGAAACATAKNDAGKKGCASVVVVAQ